MTESYPQLIIVPNPIFESFCIMLKTGPREIDVESVADVSKIDWRVKGKQPGWGSPRGYTKKEIKPEILILPSGPSRKQMFVLGAKYYFGDKEFVIHELIAALKDRYPNCRTNLNPRSVAATMRFTRYFETRWEDGKTYWRYVGG